MQEGERSIQGAFRSSTTLIQPQNTLRAYSSQNATPTLVAFGRLTIYRPTSRQLFALTCRHFGHRPEQRRTSHHCYSVASLHTPHLSPFDNKALGSFTGRIPHSAVHLDDCGLSPAVHTAYPFILHIPFLCSCSTFTVLATYLCRPLSDVPHSFPFVLFIYILLV